MGQVFVDILVNIFSDWLLRWLPFVAAVVVSYFVGRTKSKVEAAFYGVGTAAFIVVIVAGITADARLRRVDDSVSSSASKIEAFATSQAGIDVNNIESIVSDWMIASGYALQRIPAEPSNLFHVRV